MDNSKFDLIERVFIAGRIYSAIQKYFGHWEGLQQPTIEAEYRKYLQEIIKDISRKEFVFATMELIAALHNGHSWVYDKLLIDEFPPNFGFRFDYIENHWIITRSQTPEFPIGMIIDQIDGKSFEEYYQNQRKYINASVERGRRASFTERTYLFPKKFAMKCRTADGFVIDRMIDQTPNKNNIKTDKNIEFEAIWLEEGNIGYMNLPHFRDPDIEEKALHWVEQFSTGSAIIFDLRGNQGGSTPERLVEKLMDRPYRWWTESAPLNFSIQEFYFQYYDNLLQQEELNIEAKRKLKENRANFEIFNNPSLKWMSPWQNPIQNPYIGKIVILVDRNTRSAGEDFVLPFKDTGRATIIGETTRGSSGQPYMIDCGKQLKVFIGMKRLTFPDGKLLEGVGIEPDIEVIPTIRDLQLKKPEIDPIIQRALDFLHEKTEKNHR